MTAVASNAPSGASNCHSNCGSVANSQTATPVASGDPRNSGQRSVVAMRSAGNSLASPLVSTALVSGDASLLATASGAGVGAADVWVCGDSAVGAAEFGF